MVPERAGSLRFLPYWQMVEQMLREVKVLAQLISLIRGKAAIQIKAV